MLNSFRYASYAALYGEVSGVAGERTTWNGGPAFGTSGQARRTLRGLLWTRRPGRSTLPSSSADVRVLLDTFTMQQALIELRAELGRETGTSPNSCA